MTIRILFSSGRAVGARVIEWATWSQWSHVELLRGEQLIGANWPHGVELADLSCRLKRSRHWAIGEIDADEDAVWTFARSQLHKPYDLKGALGIGFHRDWQDPSAWHCAELVAAALLESSVRVARLDAWRVVPQTIWQCPYLRTIEQQPEGA